MQSPNHFDFESTFSLDPTGLPPSTRRVINTRRRSLQKDLPKTNPPFRINEKTSVREIKVEVNKNTPPKVRLPSLQEFQVINQKKPIIGVPVKLIPINRPKDSLQPESYLLKIVNDNNSFAENSETGISMEEAIGQNVVRDPTGNPVTFRTADIEKMAEGMFKGLLNTLGGSPSAKKIIEGVCTKMLDNLKKSP